MLVPKKDRIVGICTDLREPNMVIPKEDFVLLYVHGLINNNAGHALLSFIDWYVGYNQIKMAVDDIEMTTFITP